MLDASAPALTTRQRIVDASLALLAEGGREAVSTRAVSAAAGVQAPTIYRIFGDKRGLLDALAAHGFTSHVHAHTTVPTSSDPVEDLRRGWDVHVGFGLANPYLYSLIYGEPRSGPPSAAAVDAKGELAARVHRIAAAGRLVVDEDSAVRLLTAAGAGTTLTLIADPGAQGASDLSHLAREAVIAAITGPAPPHEPGPVGAAVGLRAVLPLTDALTAAERTLLGEWLDRVASGGQRGA